MIANRIRRTRVVRELLEPVLARLDRRIDARIERSIGQRNDAHKTTLPDSAARRLWIPPIEPRETDQAHEFMLHSTCSASDYSHPEFARICQSLDVRLRYLRKLWEYAFIVHHLERSGVLVPGARGIVFGVGNEPLPAYFASLGCEVVATDAPIDVADSGGWTEHRHSDSLKALTNEGICSPERFRQLVSHRFVDMNAIPDDLTDFDFAWSACCFEHLGSLRHGLDFVKASVDCCLRPGGVAVHTTEFNLSSNDKTLENPNLSIYRRRDLEGLIEDLRGGDHTVDDLTVAPDSSYLDQYVDVRPFSGDLHLKLELASYVTTSVGLVIRRSTGRC